MTKYVIALSIMGIKNYNLISLLENHSSDIVDMFNSESNGLFESNLDLAVYAELFSNKTFVNDALVKADAILSRNAELGIKTTYYTAATYPTELAQIDNPPAIIYYKGAEFTEIPSKSIACVGTRKPSRLSYNAANYLIPQLVHEECSIISGLACGVDKISHQACISANGRTIAVLAHGLDTIYPKENSSLAERILKSGGILMSEYPVGTKPDKFRFVNRNRIIVGLSKVVIIFECDANGGTMHNAEFAQKQGKAIFCPALGNEITEIQTGTKQLLDKKMVTEIKQGRDIGGILKALGSSITEIRLSNMEIKYNYLHALLHIVHTPLVIEASLKDLNLNLPISSELYNTLIDLINVGYISIDELIQSLVNNNIASIEKTLIFAD